MTNRDDLGWANSEGPAELGAREAAMPLQPAVQGRAWREVALIAAAYVLAGLAGKGVMLASGFASPVWPAAGLALAALLVAGARRWPGVWLGAFLFSLWFNRSVAGAALALVIATGATLQALLGVWLTWRVERSPLSQVARERKLLHRLLLAGPLACMVSASFGMAGLLGSGYVGASNVQGEWLIWWVGDTLGVLLFAPLVLLVWPGARPLRAHWGGSWRVALPLLLTASLLVAGNLALAHLEENEARVEVGNRMGDAYDAGFLPLPAVLAPLSGITRLFAASEQVTRQEFAIYTEHITRQTAVLAVDWAPRVPQAARGRFEAAVRAEGLRDYRIFELGNDRRPRPSVERSEYFPVLYSEPQASNAMALGLDHGFEESRRLAMARALDTAQAETSVQLDLLRTSRRALLVFLPVRAAGSAAAAHALRGYVVAVFDIEHLLAPLAVEARKRQLAWRVSDVTAGETRRVLQDTLPEGAKPGWIKEINFGSRIWRLEMQPAQAARPAGASATALLYLGFSVLAGLLAAFATLGSAGRVAATAAEVAQRTAELERELGARRLAESALRESEQDLDITLHSIGDAVLTTDTQRRITRLNAAAEQLTGWTRIEALGRPVEEVFRTIYEQTGEAMAIPVDEVLRTGEVSELANHCVLQSRDGSEWAIAESAAPIRDAESRLRGVVLVFRDVGQERAAKLALQASEERYRALIELSPFAVVVLCDGHFVFVNPKAQEMFGAGSRAELLGRPLLKFVHAESRDAMRERARLRAEGQELSPTIEAKFRKLDGSVFLGELTSVPYQHEGRPGSLILVYDITARREAEEQRDRFFSLSLDLLCIAGLDGYFKRINPAFSHTLGWSEEELMSRPYLEAVHPDDLEATQAELARLARGQATIAFENRYRCKDGSWRWLEWKALPQPNGLIFASAHDTTASHEAARQLQQLNADLIEAREDAEQASRAKSAFLATMSHEIRTPMNGVIGLVDVLAKTRLSEHQADLVSTIQDSSATLLGLIDDILDFSKIEAGRLEIERAPVCVADLVEGLCSSLVHMAALRHVDLCVFVAPDIPQRLLCDEVRLRQVLYNLVGNAIKFSSGRPDKRGRVSVRVSWAQAAPLRLALSVADNGIGIAAPALNTLFQPFSQGESSTTRRFGGTGLGLAICKRLVDLMQGQIAVQSRLGEGSAFTVTLPLEAAGEQPAAAPPELAGLQCIVLSSPEVPADDLRIYLEHAGAKVAVVADESAAAQFVTGLAGPVVLVDGAADGQLSPHAGLLTQAALRRVHLVWGQSRHDQATGPATVTLDGNALRRLTLLRAVAVAAGRASPEMARTDGDELADDQDLTPPSITEARAQGRLILVAEDDEINRKVVLQQLAQLGYAAEVADDGAAALQMWRQGGYAVLLTDVHMPEMDGYRLAETIRSEESGRSRMPILALTANALRGEARRAQEAGMDEYLTKPIRLDLLKAALARWLPPQNKTPVPTASPQDTGLGRGTPVMDVSVLTGLVGDHPSTVQKLLGSYQVSARRLTMELQAAFAGGQHQAVAAAAHKLKSSSRSVGALALGELCAALEQAGRAEDGADIAKAMREFEAVYVATDVRISELLAAP